MDNKNPTVKSLDHRISGVEEQLSGLADGLAGVEASLQDLNDNTQDQSARIWAALGVVGELDGVVKGIAEVAESLTPMRQFAPPTTYEPLAPGVARALGAIRTALGDRSPLDFNSLTTDWDGPVGFIGEPISDYRSENR
ncbi:hypothetical protein QSJ18_18070 [Gordonia sp. ABSL1-1]|uniref:hypothetical protein n=1 Tax=Gordonia sp. ABSL1-1 TaxID=3053923 RepID=UPI00257351B6|nr:hypothetical protein [Gordonia sp. ABSL1-1]MDL9938656.1 hypothetical protein [Gordonia sp. ABSL1-1]